ncbi:MAG TPA: Tex-like N-terminal domain-containing protein, partial [Spirochaetota bacterium]|nr:Tex-like N-terminal domain-containing protein [Spirochaetota bacterium]
MEINEVFIEGLVVNQAEIERKIATELNIGLLQVRNTVDLLKSGSTIPFISRYRKEATGNLDEVQVRDINHKLLFHENIETRRIEIIKGIFGQGKLSEELYENIMKATTYSEIEDLYAPFKKKKKTRGMAAIEKGLEELADLMEKVKDIEKEATRFVDEEKGVKNVKEALEGAMDIIAERIAHKVDNRKKVKDFMMQNSQFIVKGLKDGEKSVYKMYYDYKESLKTLKPHRVLAINRGEKEEELIASIDYEEDHIYKYILNDYTMNNDFHK